MTGVIELGGVAAMVFISTTVLRLAGRGYRSTSAHHRGGYRSALQWLDLLWRQDLQRSPRVQDGVKVSIDNAQLGTQSIQFDGEVLYIAGECGKDGAFQAAAALGGCDVRIEDSRTLVAMPPATSTVELIFDSPAEASDWADAFREACLAGAPHKRIHELVSHHVTLERHAGNLRNRAQKVREMEELNKKLKLKTAMQKMGFSNPVKQENVDTGPHRSLLKVLSDPALLTMFGKSSMVEDPDLRTSGSDLRTSGSTSASQPEVDFEVNELDLELQQHKDECERAIALSEKLKRQLSGCVSVEVHASVREQMHRHKENNDKAWRESDQLQRRIAEMVEMPPPAYQGTSSSSAAAPSPAALSQLPVSQKMFLECEEKKLLAARSSVRLSERRFKEQKGRAGAAASRVEAFTKENEALQAQIEALEAQENYKSRLNAETAGKGVSPDCSNKLRQQQQLLQQQQQPVPTASTLLVVRTGSMSPAASASMLASQLPSLFSASMSRASLSTPISSPASPASNGRQLSASLPHNSLARATRTVATTGLARGLGSFPIPVASPQASPSVHHFRPLENQRPLNPLRVATPKVFRSS